MNLAELIAVAPRKPTKPQHIEEKRITREEKETLDREIARQLKDGWLVKSRSHEAEGLHGVVLVRRRQEVASPA